MSIRKVRSCLYLVDDKPIELAILMQHLEEVAKLCSSQLLRSDWTLSSIKDKIDRNNSTDCREASSEDGH